LHSNKNHFIFGARRIGKTCLLQFLESKLRQEGIPAFYFSIEGYNKPEEIKKKIETTFKRKQFIGPDHTLEMKSLFNFLEEIDILCIENPIVFLIDEMEQIAEVEKNEKGFIAKFKNFVDSSNNIRFIVSASPRFQRIISEIQLSTSAFLTAFECDILPIMTYEETLEFFRKGISCKIEDDEIKNIIQYTHHQPFLIKIFMNKILKNELFHQPSINLAKKTYINNALGGLFEDYFKGLSSIDQEIVRKIYLKEFHLENRFELKVEELIQYGYLKNESGIYKISNWFFEQWLSGEKIEDDVNGYHENDIKHHCKVSKFNKIANYFRDAVNKFFLYLVIIIFLVILAIILDRKIDLSFWIFE
jgi:hypothetical protein